jgi:hypothetical protein
MFLREVHTENQSPDQAVFRQILHILNEMHNYLLFQRRDGLQRFLRDRTLPVVQQLTPMLKGPLKHKTSAC